MRPLSPAVARLLLSLLSLGLGACGAEEGRSVAPAAPVQDAGPGPAQLLGRLSERLIAGEALSDESWGQDVDFLRRLLWPDLAAQAAVQAAKTHASASHVAGDVAREIARDPGARGGFAERDPASLAVHDGWVGAARAGPEAYRKWCEGPGQDLLRRLEAERARLFERPGGAAGR